MLEGSTLMALKEESVAKILQASGTSARGAPGLEDGRDGLVSGTAAAAVVQCKDWPCCSQGYDDTDCVLVGVLLAVGSQNWKEGDYPAEKAGKHSFPSVKVEHHTEPLKWAVNTHSTHLGVQL